MNKTAEKKFNISDDVIRSSDYGEANALLALLFDRENEAINQISNFSADELHNLSTAANRLSALALKLAGDPQTAEAVAL